MKNVFGVLFLMLIQLLSLSCANTPAYTSDKSKEELISDGYSTQSSDNYTGADNEVKDIENNITLDNYLRKVSGVNVIGDGASAKIRIRGVSTVYAEQEPLFILNGTTFNGDFGSLYSMIQAIDIKSVSVLKDASSTGIYGSRGANGVVVITLKKNN